MAGNIDSSNIRATFGIEYIQGDATEVFKTNKIENSIPPPSSGEKQHSYRRKFHIKYVGNCVNTKFDETSFYYTQGKGMSFIETFTFKTCDFISCFMGSIHFKGIRFKNCSFSRTDFENSIFENCSFEDCSFENCTAAYSTFINTEIDPIKFMVGNSFPVYTYDGLNKSAIKTLKKEWIDIRLQIATAIFRSNTNIASTKFSDYGLYQLKKAQLDYKSSVIELDKISSNIKLIFSCTLIWCNLKFTKGGISSKRLICLAIIGTLIIDVCLMRSNIKYNELSLNYPLDLTYNSLFHFISILPYSISLFLGFGFTNFKSEDHTGDNLLILFSCLGILWYSLLIPIIIRKVYR